MSHVLQQDPALARSSPCHELVLANHDLADSTGALSGQSAARAALPSHLSIAPPVAPEAASQRNQLAAMQGGIVHDFRNLLAVITSALNLLERNRGDSERVDRYLAGAREAVERASALVSRLLSLARPAPRPEKLSQLIEDSLPLLAYACGDRHSVRLALQKDDPSVSVDPARFANALLNLVANARDAMPDGGEVRITTDLVPGEPQWFRVAVSDTGHGMTAATLSRVFDPWFTTKQGTGTGLGLPQVRAFMQSLHGRVHVTSEPGSGTTLELLFPVPDGPDSATSKTAIENWVNEGGSFSSGVTNHA